MAYTSVGLTHDETAVNLYMLIWSSDAQKIFDATTDLIFEAYQTANLGDYDIAGTELGTASRRYSFTIPSTVGNGDYDIVIHKRVGGAPAEGDPVVGTGSIVWNGSALIGFGGGVGTLLADVITFKGQAVTCTAPVTVLASVGTAATSTAQTGDGYAIVNSGTHGNAAIKGYVDDIGTAGAGLTAVPWNAAWDAEVQSECEDALAAYGAATAAALATVDDFLDTEIAAIKTKTDYLPSATAGASGGLMIAGSNAATTFASVTCTGSLTVSDGLTITCSTPDTSAITATGNGAGHGISATGGISGHGMRLLGGGGSGSGDALNLTGSAGYVGLRASSITVTGAMTANITGSLSGSVGSISGVTFPANFSAAVISAAGIVSSDVQYVNAIEITGAGTSGSPWGPV